MKTIWKQILKITDIQTITVPEFSKILSVQMQGDSLCVWYFVPDMNTQVIEAVTFLILGTGNPYSGWIEPYKFLGTIQKDSFVGHVFYKQGYD
jgi:hypothetical protein